MILVVDDDKTLRLSLKLILERNDYAVALAEEPKAAVAIVRSHPDVELVLMDMNFTAGGAYAHSTDGEEGLTLLRQIKLFRPDLPCILMTAWGTIDLAVQGMRTGAFDFITKPWDNGVLMDRIETAIRLRQHADTPSPARQGAEAAGAVHLPSLASIYSTIARIAPTNAPVLITGESGTGKELIAEAIHRQSRRARGPFVKVNLGGISSSLFESEMFGHKKGAFTDAKSDRTGRFELADGGTIFLDEIGELDLACQVKLLRVLQDQTYEVLGDSRTRRTDVRVVCATNADLSQMVQDRTFREDLYYRINLIGIHLPPLRERREDIPLLVEHFVRQTCERDRLPLPTVTAAAIDYLRTLPLPGNIRELKNLTQRAVLMAQDVALTPMDFGAEGHGDGSLPPCPSDTSLAALERTAIAAAIRKHGGNLSIVAKELGISRGALYRKMEKYGL